MDETTISQLMLSDHESLEQIFQNLGTGTLSHQQLNDLRFRIEEHFLIEEKAIFSMVDTSDQQAYQDVKTLLNEHELMLGKLRELQVRGATHSDLKILKEAIIAHRCFEDKTFYPMLDQTLKASDKEKIIEIIRQHQE